MNVFQQHLSLLLHQTGQQDRNAYTQLLQLTAPSIAQCLHTCYGDDNTICRLLTRTYLDVWHQSHEVHSQAHPLRTIIAYLQQAGIRDMGLKNWNPYRQPLWLLADHFAYDQAFLFTEQSTDTDHFTQHQQYLSLLTPRQQDIYFLAGMEHFHMPVLARMYYLSMQEIWQEFMTALTTVQIHVLLAMSTKKKRLS